MNFVDFNGFPCENSGYVVKELATVSIKDSVCSISHFIYAPPYEWENVASKKKVRYQRLSRNSRKLKWSDGSRLYLRLTTDLSLLHGVIWTFGEKKSIFLSDIIGREVYNLEDIGTFHLECDDGDYQCCALQNVFTYYSWLRPKFCISLRSDDVQCSWHAAISKPSRHTVNDARSSHWNESHQHGLWSGSEAARRQRRPSTTKGAGSQHDACGVPPRLAQSANQTTAGSPSESPTLPDWTTEHLWCQNLRRRRQGCPSFHSYAASQSTASIAPASSDSYSD